MYGRTTGSLSVRLFPRGQPNKKLFFKSGQQGHKWKRARVTLDTNVRYQVS